MSWLRDHFYKFVFPAFEAATKQTTEIGQPFDVKASKHAPERLPAELRKLWTLCQDHQIEWSYDVREVNYFGGSSKYRESAKLHQNVLRATLDSAMSALRGERCDRLFLGGRDVWTFAVLCEKRRIPYMFVPELSRSVAQDLKVKPFLEAKGFKGTELFLDTGFSGSIPRSLAAHFERPFKFRLMSQSGGSGPRGDRPKLRPNQLFPNRKLARDEALETEYLAKYWRAGTCIGAERIIFAPDYEKWRYIHPGPVYRYKKEGVHQSGYGLTDGTRWEFLATTDIGLAPGFVEWWLTLPEKPAEWAPTTEIGQFFSDKKTIQRAALLTSQLWRGIPYWKFKDERPKQSKAMVLYNQDNLSVNGNASVIYTGPSTLTAATTNTFTTTANWIVSDNSAATISFSPSINGTVFTV